MSQNTIRKEPTFGEPSASVANNVETLTETVKTAETEAVKFVSPKISLHSTSAPSYNFTPIIKRPVTSATEFKTIEETQSVNMNNSIQNPEALKASETAQPTSGFAFSPVTEKVENIATAATNTAEKVAEKAEDKLNTIERVIPVATKVVSEKATKASSLSTRRLGLVAVLLAILGAIFFWLKPSSPETVEELQSQQNNSLPIEFRPVDEEEAKRAEAQAKAEQEALAQQQAQQDQAQQAQTTPQPEQAMQQLQVDPNAPVQPVPAEFAQPATTQPVVAEPTQQQTAVVEPAHSQPIVAVKPKTAPLKPAEKPRIKAITAEEFNVKKASNAQMDQLVKNVKEGKPVVISKPVIKSTIAPSVSSKTMTVPKGTSLMQVFRDNGLNIADVNAMSKVNNVVSNLKVGERITVRLDKNNRVVELSIGSGGKFTRQTDGSYNFK